MSTNGLSTLEVLITHMKMKILAINNYSIDRAIKFNKSKLQPATHSWGVDYLRSKGHEVDLMQFNHSGGNIHLSTLRFCLKHYSKFRQYDVIISFCNPAIGWCSYLKKIGLMRNVRLYTLVHHKGRFMELGSGFNRIFFLSRQVMEKTKVQRPHLANKMTYLEWGPDIDFYQETYEEHLLREFSHIPSAISNGKTKRDLTVAEAACQELGMSLVAITDAVDLRYAKVVSSGLKGKNAITYRDMLKYMNGCDILLIPVVSEKSPDSLCGLTSFADALAMGMPIVMSDNTNISVDIEELRIGKVYRAGNKEDMKRQLSYFVDHPEKIKEYGRNARNYAERHTYLDYCRQLEKFLSE